MCVGSKRRNVVEGRDGTLCRVRVETAKSRCAEESRRCRARESYIEDVSRVVNEPAMAATNGSEALKYRGLIVYGWVSTEVEALRCGGSYPIPNGRHHGM
jgi:hypothetical protein